MCQDFFMLGVARYLLTGSGQHAQHRFLVDNISGNTRGCCLLHSCSIYVSMVAIYWHNNVCLWHKCTCNFYMNCCAKQSNSYYTATNYTQYHYVLQRHLVDMIYICCSILTVCIPRCFAESQNHPTVHGPAEE